MRRELLLVFLVLSVSASSLAGQASPAVAGETYVSFRGGNGRFTLASAGRLAPLVVSAQDWPGVVRAANNLRTDIGRVTGTEPSLARDTVPSAREVVVIGTLGRSPLVDQLVQQGKLDTTGMSGQWEAFALQVVPRPWPGVESALVIAGSDKRGTTFGIYDLSAQIGVSPWNWWADVPVTRHSALFVAPGRHFPGPPRVKYRGFFINDEAPALSGWTRQIFGGFNHLLYERVFELLLRMKGNYLWPAMWGNAFNADDTLNNRLADEYGVVMGTSHHEPMLRAQQEWRRFGSGQWNYETNRDTLRSFWRQGVLNMGSHESIVTVGMRGDGDMPMSRESNIALLERIVADQRAIIADVTGRGPAAVPQLWALYKEVQTYYDRGMRVPDDVTLLFADDNWGNIRRLPERGAAPRAGGYGVYYHYDYVGGPRNYKWLNTNAIARVWEQMHLAYRHGVDRIWIVNVGDIKPMEYPLQFFLDYAWNPDRWPAERMAEYPRLWAQQQFGSEHAEAVAALLNGYARLSARRKPELIVPATWSLTDYREAEIVVAEYRALEAEAQRVSAALPAASRDAFYQLVLHPIMAQANLNDLYVTTARNRLAAAQGRVATNDLAARVRQLFARDAEITRYYNDTLAGGKWPHMMDQTHIGYRIWQEPRVNAIPELQEISAPVAAELGVTIEGTERWWPRDTGAALLPELDPYGPRSRYIDVFNRGLTAFDYEARSEAPWLTITPRRGSVAQDQRLEVSVDWQRAPAGRTRVPITITGAGGTVTITAQLFRPPVPQSPSPRFRGFVESNGVVAMEAEHFTRAVDAAPLRWQRIPELGRTLSGMTPFPVTAPRQAPGGASPRLEYRVLLFDSGTVTVRAVFSPTLDYLAAGLRYAVSIDDGEPQIVDIAADSTLRTWERWVSDNVITATTRHVVTTPGEHILRYWMVDPGVVLQRLIVERGTIRPSYLGPPESHRQGGVDP